MSKYNRHNSKQNPKKSSTAHSCSDRLDQFGQPIPSFNINGKEKITSQVGLCTSLIVYILVLFFLCVRGITLVQRSNPIIVYGEIPSHYDDSFRFDLEQNDFKMAFGV